MPRGQKSPLCAAALCALIAGACSPTADVVSPAGRAAPNAPGVRIVDDIGRSVALAKPATRIAALSPGFVESLFSIGCGDAVALRDAWSDAPAPLVDAIPKVDGVQVSVRNVAGFEPDLVLLYADDGRFAEELGRVGIPAVVLNPRTYEEVAEMIAKLGALCGREAEARRVAASMRTARARVASGGDPAHRPSVYIEIDATDPTRPWASGAGSFVDELVSIAGGRNALTGLPSAYAQVSAEAVIRSDPDVILLARDAGGERASASEITGRPGWSSVRAVVEGRVIDGIDDDILSRPGPRLAEGLRALATALRPSAPRDGGAP
jgi:iron complex transport system substrate-binding protein